MRLRPGTGVIVVNGRLFEQYFLILSHRVINWSRCASPRPPRSTTSTPPSTAEGEWPGGRAAPRRRPALVDLDDEARPQLKKAGLPSRGRREKERRKYGLKKARKAPQYSKR